MEGKVALFKKFAEIDGFDIEVNETDPKKLAEIVIALEPTFGAVNLEDIKAPGVLRGRADLQGADEHSRSSTTTSTARRSSWPPE